MYAVIDYIVKESDYGGYEVAVRCDSGWSPLHVRPAHVITLAHVMTRHALELGTRVNVVSLKGRTKEAALLEQPYTALAQLLNCDAACIAVVNSATAAWQRIFLGLPLWQPGSRILTSVAEYGSNYIAYLQVCILGQTFRTCTILDAVTPYQCNTHCALLRQLANFAHSSIYLSSSPSYCTPPKIQHQVTKYCWQVARRFGVTIQVIHETTDGDIDIQHLDELLHSREFQGFTLVSISHIPTSSGRVYDAAAVGRSVARHPGTHSPPALDAHGPCSNCTSSCLNPSNKSSATAAGEKCGGN
jgi:hypothetical protein